MSHEFTIAFTSLFTDALFTCRFIGSVSDRHDSTCGRFIRRSLRSGLCPPRQRCHGNEEISISWQFEQL